MVSGAVSVRDFGTAYAAAMLVPDDDSNGRVGSLIQGVLRGADEQFLQGPRALPLSVRDVDYARALCAAGNAMRSLGCCRRIVKRYRTRKSAPFSGTAREVGGRWTWDVD